MATRFCPSCGKSITKSEEFCVDCKPKEDIIFKDIFFHYCGRCGNYLFKNKWKPSADVQEAATKVVLGSVKQPLTDVKAKIPNVTIAPGVNVDFKAAGEYDKVEYEIPGRFLVTICPKCSKAGTTYFEGILQIRNPNDDVVAFIKKMLINAEKEGVHATTIKDVKGGIDFYLSSKKFLRKIGKELKNRFSGELKESPQLFSRNSLTSKDIYRLNVLFRCE